MTGTRHRILIATDGSPPASAALDTVVNFPWPASSQAQAVVASAAWIASGSPGVHEHLQHVSHDIAAAARAKLRRRWPHAEALQLEMPAVDAIFHQADFYGATLIALGWRGHGTFHRLLAGSVSRAVAERASCPVLVVHQAPPSIKRFVFGYDGTPNAERAVELLCALNPRGCEGEVFVVDVVEHLHMPASVNMLPASERAKLTAELAELRSERETNARGRVEVAVHRLTEAGWRASGHVLHGEPLASLLDASQQFRADVLVLGARAVSGLERALLGSVASGALHRSAVPVLLAR